LSLWKRHGFVSKTVIQKKRPMYPLRETLHISIKDCRNFSFTSSFSGLVRCVYVWYVYVCLVWSGICACASHSVWLLVCLCHVCHMRESVHSQLCCIKRQLDHPLLRKQLPSFKGKAAIFSAFFNFRYISALFVSLYFDRSDSFF